MYIQIEGKELNDFRGKKIILFGAGGRGIHAIDEFEGIGAEIVAFCDNNPSLRGETLCDYPIIAPEDIKDYNGIDILITSVYSREIKKQLNDMGYYNNYAVSMGVANDTLCESKFSNNILDKYEANEIIYNGLSGKASFCISRLGSVELETLCDYCGYIGEKGVYPQNQKNTMNINAGFFPTTDDMLNQFSKLYLEDLSIMDYMWCMWFSKFENRIYEDYIPETPILRYNDTYMPIDFENPWTKALEHKKVLVIHPFENSIKNNYQIREKLFENPDILPQFDLKTIKAVQSIAGTKVDYKDWFEALKSMEEKMQNIDYDIALVGAGAYGLPLAAFAKQQGKKAVHLGGALQLLFGIKGKAWNKLGIYNEYWTNPLDNERPQGYKSVEAGRYW